MMHEEKTTGDSTLQKVWMLDPKAQFKRRTI